MKNRVLIGLYLFGVVVLVGCLVYITSFGYSGWLPFVAGGATAVSISCVLIMMRR